MAEIGYTGGGYGESRGRGFNPYGGGDTMPNGYTITDRQEFATGSPQLAAALARIRAGGML